MDFNAVRLFVSAVQAGSLSGGAERAGVPLPTLSRQVRALERSLKVQLFERSARGVRLTVEGTRLYEYAVRGIEALADGERAVIGSQAQLKGQLRLSVPPAFEPWWEMLREFRAQHPDIQIRVYTTERRVDLIHDGIDVALRVGDIVDDTLVARELFRYRHVLVAAPSLIERIGEPQTIDDVRRFPILAWASGIDTRVTWMLGGERFDPEVVLTSNDYLRLRDAAAAGDGLTEMPAFIAAPYLADHRLRQILPTHPLPEQTVRLLYHAHRFPSTIVRAYLDFCRDHLHTHLNH